MNIARSALVLLASLAPCATAQDLQLTKAVDYNPHPRIFETVLFPYVTNVQLVDGGKTQMMVYNGGSPGPTIEANVGDTLIVHFLNLLPEPTTLHWHGVEMPARMDGSHISQPKIPRFGYFRYEFKLTNAATYWYHPHFNTNQQVEKGLFGALIVRNKKEDGNLRIPRWRERVVFLDDVKLDAQNQVAPFGTDPTSALTPEERAEEIVNSRPGSHVLVNSAEVKPGNIPTLEVLSGAAYRLRFINVSSGETFRLDLSDPKQKWYGIGSDQGLWNKAETIKPIDKVVHHGHTISNPDTRLGVTLTPSDRFEVVIHPKGSVNTEYFIDFHDFVKGTHIAKRDPMNNLVFGHDPSDGAGAPVHGIRIKIVGVEKKTWKPKSKLRHRKIKRLNVDLSKPALPVVFGHAAPTATGDVIFFANVARAQDLLDSVHARQMTMPPMFGPKPMAKLTATDGYHVKVGDVTHWEVVNFTGGDHNFHSHGFAFQHVETEFIDLDTPANNRRVSPHRLAYEDTIRVPRRTGAMGRSFAIVRLAVRFDDKAKPRSLRRESQDLLAGGLVPTAMKSGGWLVHCHLLEHSAKGMMSFITVTK